MILHIAGADGTCQRCGADLGGADLGGGWTEGHAVLADGKDMWDVTAGRGEPGWKGVAVDCERK